MSQLNRNLADQTLVMSGCSPVSMLATCSAWTVRRWSTARKAANSRWDSSSHLDCLTAANLTWANPTLLSRTLDLCWIQVRRCRTVAMLGCFRASMSVMYWARTEPRCSAVRKAESLGRHSPSRLGFLTPSNRMSLNQTLAILKSDSCWTEVRRCRMQLTSS